MGTVRSAIQLYDGMTPALRSMTRSMNICLNTMESMQAASAKPIDTAAIQSARDELARVEAGYDNIEQSIRNASAESGGFTSEASSGIDSLISKAKSFAVTLGTAMSAKKAIELSDTWSQTTARLDLMNDGLQKTEQLQQMIFNSAQKSRGAYQDTADLVAKLGVNAKDAFSSSAEIVAFAEQVNKQFVISGASAVETKNATLQLTQALSSGVLRGDELRSIFEQAPTLIRTVADYMGEPIGKIRDLAAEGKITADVVKNALIGATDDTNAKFNEMPYTWSQIWTDMKNDALIAFQPLLEKISELANNADFTEHIQSLTNVVSVFGSIACGVFEAAAGLAGFFADNMWLTIPVIGALVTATLIYRAVNAELAKSKLAAAAASGVEASVEGAENAVKSKNTIATLVATATKWKETSAKNMGFFATIKAMAADKLHNAVTNTKTLCTNAATIAQYGLNAAMNACPVLLLVTGIASLIGLFGGLVGTMDDTSSTMADMDGTDIQMQYEALYSGDASAMDELQKTYSVGAVGNIEDGVVTIADNTGDHEVSIKDDDIEIMRDIAERQTINRFTTAEIKVDMTNNNSISSEADIDDICSKLEDKVYEGMQTAAEGVHA